MSERRTYRVGQVLQTNENAGIHPGSLLLKLNHTDVQQMEHDDVIRALQHRPLLLRFQLADGQQFDRRFEEGGQLGLELNHTVANPSRDTASPSGGRRASLSNSRVSGDGSVFSEDQWQPDEEAAECPLCSRPFTTMRRRHHCRTCMMVICGKCSRGTAKLSPSKKERICDECAKEAQGLWSNVTEAGENTTVDEMRSALEAEHWRRIAESRQNKVLRKKTKMSAMLLVMQVTSPRVGFSMMQSAVRNWRLALSASLAQQQRDRMKIPLIKLHRAVCSLRREYTSLWEEIVSGIIKEHDTLEREISTAVQQVQHRVKRIKGGNVRAGQDDESCKSCSIQ